MSERFRSLQVSYPGLLDALDRSVTPERLLGVLQAVADTPAPSQAASFTRGSVIADMIEQWGLASRGATYTRDLESSGCDVLEYGHGGLRMVAHLDEISYLLSGTLQNRGWPLTAYCYHLADGPRDARVLRYAPTEGYRIVSSGILSTDAESIWYRPSDGTCLEPGDRIVLEARLELEQDGSRVTGSLDNAAGVASVLLAAEALTSVDVPFSIVLTDEEEGPAGYASQTISRGATRVLPHLPSAPLTVVIDVHGLADEERASVQGHRRPWGVSLAEYSSAGRGSVTPPHLYRILNDLAAELTEAGIVVRQNIGGYVPRSDDIAVMMQSNVVCLLGYPGSNRHFDSGLPAANIHDLVNLAKSLTVMAAAMESGILGLNKGCA